MHKWTQEQFEFVKQNIKGTPYKKMQEMLNERFGLNLTYEQVKGFLSRNKFTNGLDARFKKGQTSWNKGKKGLRFKGSEKGWFKKGQKPHNHKPLGYERIDRDGYVVVKVREKGPWHKRWRLKHQLIWEEKHGPIPEGHAVIFADGNKLNFSEDNLVLVSRQQLLMLNRNGLIKNDKDLTKTGIALADLMIKMSERRGELE